MQQKQIIINNVLRNYSIQKTDDTDEVLVFLHGRGQSYKSFDVLTKKLEHYTIVAPDFPGFGGSHRPSTARTVDEYANQLNDFLQALGIHKATFITHSFGGRVLIALYQLHTIRINKIIFIASGGHKPPITTKGKIFLAIRKIADKLGLTKLIHNTRIERYIKLIFSSKDYQDATGIMNEIVKLAINYDQSNTLHNIQVPSLLIWGAKDEATPVTDAYYFHKHIKNSQLAIHPHATHFVFQEYPERTIDLINKFLNADSSVPLNYTNRKIGNIRVSEYCF